MNKTLKIIVVILIFVAFFILAQILIDKFKPVPPPVEINTEKVIVTYPRAQEQISSPLIVKGMARGNWYFEASFPVVLTNWNGLIIGQGIAQAEGDWMTTNYVPFTATIDFEKPSYGKNGFLILKKDNPSGLPEYDGAIEIPINFK